jgi:uncharacterized membrane protein
MISTIVIFIQLLIFFILPFYLIRLSRKAKLNQWLSDIVICYGLGMLLGNTKSLWLYSWASILTDDFQPIVNLTTEVAKNSASVAVLLAIPMLLMINNVTDWLKYTGKISWVFFMGVFSTMFVTTLMGYLYRNELSDVAIASGMFAGVYIGGTPNMVAISKALNAPDSLFVILNATDTICSGLYFLFLISFGKVLLGLVLPRFQSKHTAQEIVEEIKEEAAHPFPPTQWSWPHMRALVIGTLLAIAAIAVSVLVAILFPDVKGELNQPVLMLMLTTVGISFSLVPRIRMLHGVFNYAQYLLLIFGLAAGFMTDFSLLLNIGSDYLRMNVIVILLIIIIHLLLSFIFRADVDSFMVSSTACIMGPPFVAQLCASIKNKELLPVGIALSLLGFGLANFAGLAVAWMVENF